MLCVHFFITNHVMDWKVEDNQLRKEFRFSDFKAAMAFMQLVAFEAEFLGHHPEWTNVYNTVRIRLYTHDAGNVITDRDHRLADAIDRIYTDYFA